MSAEKGGVFMGTDPVCLTPISEKRADEKAKYQGKPYCFCGRLCRERFEKDPKKYLRGEKKYWFKE